MHGQNAALSLSPSCVMRKTTARKKWQREILRSSLSFRVLLVPRPQGRHTTFFSSRFSLASRTTDVVYLETNEVNMLPYFPKPLGGPLGCLGCTLAAPFIFYQTKHGSQINNLEIRGSQKGILAKEKILKQGLLIMMLIVSLLQISHIELCFSH